MKRIGAERSNSSRDGFSVLMEEKCVSQQQQDGVRRSSGVQSSSKKKSKVKRDIVSIINVSQSAASHSKTDMTELSLLISHQTHSKQQ